jgi:hypothetical protein
MYRVEGLTTSVLWNNQDLNFDGQKISTSPLRGYNDWEHVDLRQIGATGSLSVVGGITKGGSGITKGGSGITKGGSGITRGGTGITKGGSGITKGGSGIGNGELTHQVANSVTRPPRNLTASLLLAPLSIRLNWLAPTFGQIAAYNIYRAEDGTPVVPAYASVAGNLTAYTDANVTCGPTYTYFVTAVLAGTEGQESVPTNSVSLTACVPPYAFNGFLSPLQTAGDSSFSGAFTQGKAVPAKWQLKDTSGNYVTDLNVNTLGAKYLGPMPSSGVCPLPGAVPAGFDQPPLYSPTTGAKGNSTFRYDSKNNQFIFNWDTKGYSKGCYILELDLNSGQVLRTALQLK